MAKRLIELLPEFANELHTLLADQSDLQESVDSLTIVDRCRCDDVFCDSFYTLPPPEGAWGSGLETIELEPESGMIILDVIDRRIGLIEVINRDDVRDLVVKLIPGWTHSLPVVFLPV